MLAHPVIRHRIFRSGLDLAFAGAVGIVDFSHANHLGIILIEHIFELQLDVVLVINVPLEESVCQLFGFAEFVVFVLREFLLVYLGDV